MTPTRHLATLRDDIKAHVRASFPVDVVRTVDFHDGDFGVSEVDRYSKVAPAVILVANGGKSETLGGGAAVYENHEFHAFLLAKRHDGDARTTLALVMYEHMLKLLHGKRWPTSEVVRRPTDVDGRNVYSAEIDKRALALWAVMWKQRIEIPINDSDGPLDEFRRFWAEYSSLEPTDDPADIAATRQMVELEHDE